MVLTIMLMATMLLIPIYLSTSINATNSQGGIKKILANEKEIK